VCADDYAVLERNAQRGWHYVGYGSEILRLDAAEPEGKATNVLVTLRVRPGSRVDASGRVIKKLEGAGPLALSLSLQQRGADWLIHDIVNFGRVSP